MITISIVSHKQNHLVKNLTQQLIKFPEIKQIIITVNVPDEELNIDSEKIIYINNLSPKSFSSNHNAAFKISTTTFFCVLNPDIIFINNPFPKLLLSFSDSKVGLSAPIIINEKKQIEDSVRYFPTLISLFKRLVLAKSDVCENPDKSQGLFWTAGMFLLFSTISFKRIKGFDESYFLYCEDIDICRRIIKEGYSINVVKEAAVIHLARRSSRKNIFYLFIHIKSLIIYYKKFRKK